MNQILVDCRKTDSLCFLPFWALDEHYVQGVLSYYVLCTLYYVLCTMFMYNVLCTGCLIIISQAKILQGVLR